MKYYLYFLMVFVLLGCKNHPTEPVSNKPCPLPYLFTCQSCSPIGSHHSFQLSPDGTKLLYSNSDALLNVLDLKSLKVQNIDFQSIFPKNMVFYGLSNQSFWCPYDNSKIVAHVITKTDTVGDGKYYFTGEQLIYIDIDKSTYKIYSPKSFGITGYLPGFGFFAWMPYSKVNSDFLYIGYKLPSGSDFYGIFCPQNQLSQKFEFSGIFAYTYYDKYYFNSIHDNSIDTYDNLRFYINHNELHLHDLNFTNISSGNFSPSGNLLALSANVLNSSMKTARLNEIWIVDVEKFMQHPDSVPPMKIINIKDKFCMFSYITTATFLSESTLAVSMFKDGDSFQYLYEIDLNGNMVRQLTFVP